MEYPHLPWSPKDVEDLTEVERTFYLEGVRHLRKSKAPSTPKGRR